MKTVGQITRQRGELAIVNQEPSWQRLFACWDYAHSNGDAHFHLAAEPDEDSRARSFAAMENGVSTCAYSLCYAKLGYSA